jgi:hypothetical protein
MIQLPFLRVKINRFLIVLEFPKENNFHENSTAKHPLAKLKIPTVSYF